MEVDGQLDHQSVKSHSFQADSSRAMRYKVANLVIATQPPKVKYFLNKITIIIALIPAPQYHLKVKYWDFCYNVSTTSHRRTKKLTTSTLRATSSVIKTYRTL